MMTNGRESGDGQFPRQWETEGLVGMTVAWGLWRGHWRGLCEH